MASITEEAMANPVFMASHWANEWSRQTLADGELGGDKLKETMAGATKVFSTFATPALGEFLANTGLSHHPELIRFMHRISKVISEDTLVSPQGGTHKPQVGKDPAKKLYPGMN